MEAGPSRRGGAVLAEQGKLLLEKLSGGPVAQDFPVHAVHAAGDIVTVFLPDSLHAPALGEVAADKTVIVLIGATLTGGIGVAVVEGRDQGLNTVCVLELWGFSSWPPLLSSHQWLGVQFMQNPPPLLFFNCQRVPIMRAVL